MLDKIVTIVVAVILAASFLFPAAAQVCDEWFGGETDDVRDARAPF